MKAINTPKRITTIIILTFLILAQSQIFAQYKLELDWQKNIERIVSITKSDNDSLLYVAFKNLIVTVITKDGSIVKSDSVEGTYNIKLSRDGKTLVAADTSGVGLLDPRTFKRIYWNSDKNNDFRSLTFNDKQNKYLICSWTNIMNSWSSLLKIYDAPSKSLLKEINTFDDRVINAKITGDGKYIVYSYTIEYIKPLETLCYLKIIDLNGNIVKDCGEINSTNFSLTNDGKSLIYCKFDSIYQFDFESMKVNDELQINNPFYDKKPLAIEVSNYNNFILVGTKDGLIYTDIKRKKHYYANDFGNWNTFNLNKNDSTLYATWSNVLYKFYISPTTSIQSETNNEFSLQAQSNELIITYSNLLNSTQTFNILSLDGKLIKTLSNNEVKQSSNETKIDISTLSTGIYFLQITEANKSIATKKFVKE